jgi:carbonic anhydrase
MRGFLLVFGVDAFFRGLVRRDRQVSLVVKDVPVPPFASLEECTEGYNYCMGNQVTTEPDYDTTTTTTTTEPVSTTPLPPMRRGEVGTPDHTDAKPGYKPPTAYDGKPDAASGWDYNEHGDDWPSTCQGEGQSPIDIVKYVDIGGQTKSVLWFDYYADDAIAADSKSAITNAGHGIFFPPKEGEHPFDLGYVKIGTAEFEAYEWMVHTPSEHTIDGQLFPLEIQVLHKDASGKELAVSVLFKYGASNKFLAAVKDQVPEVQQWTVEAGKASMPLSGDKPDVFNLENILPMGDVHPGGDMTFYNYDGSHTQPPCKEGVSWWVSAEPVEATKDEIMNFRKAIIGADSTKHGNNRVTQPLHGRKVLVGHTGFQHHVKHHGHKQEQKPDSRGYSSQDTPWAEAK